MYWNNGCRITTGKTADINNSDQIANKDALHEELEIKCFYEGTATLLIESQAVSVKAGDVVVINPYEFHTTVYTGETKGKYHLFMIPLDYFNGIPELDLHDFFYLQEKCFQTHFSGNAQMYDFLQRAADEVEQHPAENDLMIKSLLMGFFALLQRHGISSNEKAVLQKKSLRLYSVIKPALHCIKNDYHRSLTVDEMASLCKVSKHYFCRIFKSVTGNAPKEYLRDFRLRVANALLHNTTKSISEISELCGFENPNYFSRCYKNQYKKVPSSSRERVSQ